MIDNRILEAFCLVRGVSVSSVADANNKDRRACYTRYMIHAYLHDELGMSTNAIARMSGVSRRWVCRGIQTVRNHLAIYKDVRSEYDGAVEMLGGGS